MIPFQPSVTSSPEAVCQELTTVVVSGVTSSMSKDMLLNYFENSRRSGGGDIQDLNINVKKGKAHITFINSEGNLGVSFLCFFFFTSKIVIQTFGYCMTDI